MEKKNCIHYLVPTCNPTAMKEKLLKSLKNFAEVKDYVSFGFVFQKYTPEQIQEVVDECAKYGLDCRYVVKEYEFEKGYVPSIRMRDDAAMLNTDAKYYALIDDDIVFSDEYPYFIADVVKSILQYFEMYPKCGLISVTGSGEQGIIKPNSHYLYIFTDLGEYYRNIFPGGHMLPEECLDLLAGGDDTVADKVFAKMGYFAALCQARCGVHFEIKPREQQGGTIYGWYTVDPTHPNLVANYLIENFKGVKYDYDQLKREKIFPPNFIVPKRNRT